MALTRIDCQHFCPTDRADVASCVALNPMFMPGSLVFAGAVAPGASLGAQVACKLAIEHFVSAVLDFCEQKRQAIRGNLPIGELSTEILETAFKNANTSVYGFGHKLAAGGRMSAELLGMVVQDRIVAAGRVGPAVAYLYRAGELCPFFERREFGDNQATRENLVGAHSLVSVELATVNAFPGDIVACFSEQLSLDQELQLAVLLAEIEGDRIEISQSDLSRVLKRLFGSSVTQAFASIAKLGPEALYLSEAVD